MSRKLFLVCAACLMAVILIGITYGFTGEVLHSTEAPNQHYKVEITQRRFIVERAVYLNAYRNDEPLVRRKLLYTGDFMDEDFRELYPNYAWLSDSVLRIGQNANVADNVLRVSNETQSRIKYLLIETSDNKLVLFDVEPKASVNFPFPYRSGLSCQGAFSDSGERFSDAVETTNQGQDVAKAQFLIRINGDKSNIESPQLELKHLTCCAPDRPDFEHEWSY